MIISNVSRNDKDTGEVLILLSKREAQDLQNIVEDYSNQNKRKKIAKRMSKELEDNMRIW